MATEPRPSSLPAAPTAADTGTNTNPEKKVADTPPLVGQATINESIPSVTVVQEGAAGSTVLIKFTLPFQQTVSTAAEKKDEKYRKIFSFLADFFSMVAFSISKFFTAYGGIIASLSVGFVAFLSARAANYKSKKQDLEKLTQLQTVENQLEKEVRPSEPVENNTISYQFIDNRLNNSNATKEWLEGLGLDLNTKGGCQSKDTPVYFFIFLFQVGSTICDCIIAAKKAANSSVSTDTLSGISILLFALALTLAKALEHYQKENIQRREKEHSEQIGFLTSLKTVREQHTQPSKRPIVMTADTKATGTIPNLSAPTSLPPVATSTPTPIALISAGTNTGQPSPRSTHTTTFFSSPPPVASSSAHPPSTGSVITANASNKPDLIIHLDSSHS
jgi:hypothetical protein